MADDPYVYNPNPSKPVELAARHDFDDVVEELRAVKSVLRGIQSLLAAIVIIAATVLWFVLFPKHS